MFAADTDRRGGADRGEKHDVSDTRVTGVTENVAQ